MLKIPVGGDEDIEVLCRGPQKFAVSMPLQPTAATVRTS
jgi:hypothetical protein